jgi:phage portal protein BeeE
VALLDRVADALPARPEARSSVDAWVADYLIPASWQSFSYGGATYPLGLSTSYGPSRAMEVDGSLPGFVAALRRCPPAFAAQMVRASVLSQARFTFRNLPSSTGRAVPRKTFGTQGLAVLERPWTNGTSGELISRMEWHAGLAGNAFVTNYWPGRLRVLRPDWTVIVYGSQREPDDPAHALDGDVIGYVYQNGGWSSGNEPTALTPVEVAHWAPVPDPLNAGLGMSWVTPAVREMQGDVLASQHKIKFFENGATPNLVVKGIPAATREQFNQIVDMMEERHAGVANAYRSLYLTQGADATVVGSDLSQIDFKATQGAGETRIAALSRVHPVILGIAEGLAGSSLNAGNFGMARRIWGDTWIYPTLQDMCRALAPLLTVPAGAELWHDTTDMPILREDAKDAADIVSVNAATIGNLVKEGFTPDSAVAAVMGQNMTLLKHSGLLSVQLQPPGASAGAANPPAMPDPSMNGQG